MFAVASARSVASFGGAPLGVSTRVNHGLSSTMTPDAHRILASLQQVSVQRAANHGDPRQEAHVAAVKAYQQRRFRLTYAELLNDSRYGPAARFFLDELYGPTDYRERDAQFERVVPALARLFPKEMVHTVSLLAELHALSESLDAAMAGHIMSLPLSATGYVAAWRAAGRRADRASQIQLMLKVGTALDRYTHNPLLRSSLRLMRGPARAAGLSSLQDFLEKGFDTFRAMRGASVFLSTIAEREQELVTALFDESNLADALPLSKQLP